MTVPSRYGEGAGPYRLLQGEDLEVSFEESGLVLNKSPLILGPGESPDMLNVRLWDGGFSSDYALSLLGARYASSGDKSIIGMFEFQRKSLSVVLVRIRPTGWDRWNGSTWLTLTGTLSGAAANRPQAVVMQDLFIAALANLTNKLQKWDGVDGNAIADLSADAPIAKFIAPMGQRLVAAVVKSGSDWDPYIVKWSADGDITDWTTAADGAGTVLLEPEGKTGSPELINGISALETALAIYRSRSIMLGTRTGVGSQPFRFNTVVFGLGTDSPHTIASVGATVGDLFLGSDMNVYLFDARKPPVPVGDPIWKALRGQVNDPSDCYGIVDRRLGEYWLITPLGGSATPDYAWIFNLRKFIATGRLEWRKRYLGTGYLSLGFAATTAGVNPTVDSQTAIVDTIGTVVNEYSNVFTAQCLVVGDDAGGVKFLDVSSTIAGQFTTKDFGSLKSETRLDRLYIHYMAPASASIEVAISTDGGLTFGGAVSATLPAAASGGVAAISVPKIANRYRYRFSLVSGYVVITNITAERYGAGRAATAS